MQSPPQPTNEDIRLQALEEYNILDTLPEKDFDDIARIASMICGTPISLVTLIDRKRQWFKSHHGLNVSETPREYSFCAYAIENPHDVMVVPNSLNDERFRNNPLVLGEPHVIFYAGVPLVNPEGIALGTLCVIDNKASSLNEAQVNSLKALASQVVCQLELRKKIRELKESEIKVLKANEAALEEKRLRIEQFSFITSHELRHEFSKILSFIYLTKIEEPSMDDLKMYFEHIEKAAQSMNTIIEKLNDRLNPAAGNPKPAIVSSLRLSEAEEICLVDDDPIINIINSKVLEKTLPAVPLKIFESVDDGLLHIEQNPDSKRFIFLDLSFPLRSGWEFLDEFIASGGKAPIVIISSSIDPDDHEKAKKYKEVLGLYPKPLTATIIETLSR